MIAVILPPIEAASYDIKRVKKVIDRRFQKNVERCYYAHANFCIFYSNLLKTAVYPFTIDDLPNEMEIIIIVDGTAGTRCCPLVQIQNIQPKKRVFHCTSYSKLVLLEPHLDDGYEYPHKDSHIFQKLSNNAISFRNFAYGNFFTDPSVGEIDDMGFRIPYEYRNLKNRPKNHKLITIFGGSSCFSLYCLPEEVFAFLLESKLNATLESTGSDDKVSVLNFGRHDNVVLQEMLSYMLFAEELRPEIVIAHDGHNDFYYALQGDPKLLNKYDIIYPRYTEEWSKLIHNTHHVETSNLYSLAVGSFEMNMPQNVLRTYIDRKKQFQRLASASNSQFIWGVQPLHCSRIRLSDREKMYYEMAEYSQAPDQTKEKFLSAIYTLYSHLSTTLEEMHRSGEINLLDFNRIFKTLPADAEVLWDHCHTSPMGDEIIAKHYHDLIIKHLTDHSDDKESFKC